MSKLLPNDLPHVSPPRLLEIRHPGASGRARPCHLLPIGVSFVVPACPCGTSYNNGKTKGPAVKNVSSHKENLPPGLNATEGSHQSLGTLGMANTMRDWSCTLVRWNWRNVHRTAPAPVLDGWSVSHFQKHKRLYCFRALCSLLCQLLLA